MFNITPSEQQQAILNEFNNTNKNIVVEAVAGAAKTTTLLLLLREAKYRTLLIAFNKSIEEELSKRIVEYGLKQGKAMTMHSIGLMTLRHHFKKISVNKSKKWALVEAFYVKEKIKSHDTKYSLTEMYDIARMFVEDKYETILYRAEELGSNIKDSKKLQQQWKKFRTFYKEEENKKPKEIDFIDMLYLPVVLKLEVPIYPSYVFMDECQDFSFLQLCFVQKITENGITKKWVAVGDSRQSIYLFAGTYTNTMNELKVRPNTIELNLSVNYRCATSIIKEANKVYNILTPFKTEKGILGIETKIKNIEKGSLIICRNTAPLVNIYFKLLENGKACYIDGKDIFSGIENLLRPYKNSSLNHALIELKYSVEDKKLECQNNLDAYLIAKLEENIEILKTAIIALKCERETIETFLDRFKEIFHHTEEKNLIKLCTIHKSKGLEANTVYLLQRQLIPSKYAVTDEQIKQETNLLYIAITRAKEKFFYLN